MAKKNHGLIYLKNKKPENSITFEMSLFLSLIHIYDVAALDYTDLFMKALKDVFA